MENTSINLDNFVEELSRATISDNRHHYQEKATLDTQLPTSLSSASTLVRKNGLGQVLCHGRRSIAEGGELCNRHGNYSYKNDFETEIEPQVFCYQHHPDHYNRRCHAIIWTGNIVKQSRQCWSISTGGRDTESGRPLCNTHLFLKPARFISLKHEETSHPKGGIPFQPIHKSLKHYSIPNVKLPSLSKQEFRLPYNKVQTITTSYDHSQHCSVIYWDEVRDICRDAQYLLDGDTIVPFMTDDNFDYVVPLRFEYIPGAVIDVVAEKPHPHPTHTAFPKKWYLVGKDQQVLTSPIKHDPYHLIDLTNVHIVHTGAEPTLYWINIFVVVSTDAIEKLRGYTKKNPSTNNPDHLKSLADLQSIEVEVNVDIHNGMVTKFKSVCSLLNQARLLSEVPIALRAHQQIKLDKDQRLQLVLKPMAQIKQAGGLRILWVEMVNLQTASNPKPYISMSAAQMLQCPVQSSATEFKSTSTASSKGDDVVIGPTVDPNPGRWYLTLKNKEVTAAQIKSDPYVVDRRTRFTIDIKGESGLRWIIIYTSFSKSTLNHLDAVRKEGLGLPMMQRITVDVTVDKKSLKFKDLFTLSKRQAFGADSPVLLLLHRPMELDIDDRLTLEFTVGAQINQAGGFKLHNIDLVSCHLKGKALVLKDITLLERDEDYLLSRGGPKKSPTVEQKVLSNIQACGTTSGSTSNSAASNATSDTVVSAISPIATSATSGTASSTTKSFSGIVNNATRQVDDGVVEGKAAVMRAAIPRPGNYYSFMDGFAAAGLKSWRMPPDERTPALQSDLNLAMDEVMSLMTLRGNNATVNKPYHCEYHRCNERFASYEALRDHMRIHLRSVPRTLYCRVDSCDKKFADWKTFDRHQETDHSYKEHQGPDKAVEKHSVPEKPWFSALSPLPQPILFSRYSQKTRINSVVFREYRLHELSTPRLFILLPEKVIGLYGKSTHFRLFFLCGATEPKMGQDLWDRPAIHLSSDKGYQIRDADAFFEKYGAHALTMMEYARCGYRNADARIPPMSVHNMLNPIMLNTLGEHTNVFAGLKQQDLRVAMDETIDFLKYRLKESCLNVPSATKDLGDDDYCDTMDLRQLMSFLVHQHEEGILGNLYRTISKTDGCVSWMCLDHHRLHYGEHEFNATKAIVEEQGGTFNEQLRRIQFTAQSDDSLTRIRRAIQCTQDVHEISIRLEWPVYLPDLLRMPMAKDTRLVIDGTWLDGRQEIFSQPHSSNSSPSTCVELQGSSLVTALFTGRSFARVLTISTPPSINPSEENLTLRSVLLHSPDLVELELTAMTLNATEVLDCIIEAQAKLHCFRLLTLTTKEQDVASIFFNRCGNPEVLKVDRISIVFGPNYSAVGRTKFGDLFRQYGWYIKSLDTNDTFVDHHATILAIPVKGAEYKLTSLVLNAVSLSAIGLGCLDVIIYRSRSLQRLSLDLAKLHDGEQFEKAVFLLKRYGAQLTKLALSGDTTAPWITKFAGRFSTACIWPKLRTFRIVCPLDWHDVHNIPEEWHAEIVVAPSPQTSKSVAVNNDTRGSHPRQKSTRAHTSDAAVKDYKSRKAPTSALDPAHAAILKMWPTSVSSMSTPAFDMDIESISSSESMKSLNAGHTRRFSTDEMACGSCGTTSSQEWRRRLSGRKDLCNACGLRYSRSVARQNQQAQRRREGKLISGTGGTTAMAGKATLKMASELDCLAADSDHHSTQAGAPDPWLPSDTQWTQQ